MGVFTRRVERRSASLWKGTDRLNTSACQPSTGWCAGRWGPAARSKYSRCLHRPHASSSLLTWTSANEAKPGIQNMTTRPGREEDRNLFPSLRESCIILPSCPCKIYIFVYFFGEVQMNCLV